MGKNKKKKLSKEFSYKEVNTGVRRPSTGETSGKSRALQEKSRQGAVGTGRYGP